MIGDYDINQTNIRHLTSLTVKKYKGTDQTTK